MPLGWSNGKSFLGMASGHMCRYDRNSLLRRNLYEFRAFQPTFFSPDNRSLFAQQSFLSLREAQAGWHLGSLLLLRNDGWLAVSGDGHLRGSPGAGKELIYVVLTDQGFNILTPEAFAQTFGWRNQPERVQFNVR